MGETRGIRGVGAGDCKILGHATLDESGLPSWMTFTRAAGNNSYQTAPAVAGTTFIAKNAGVNVPRSHYVPSVGRRMLIIEPARTNKIADSAFADADVNEAPDGWGAGANPTTRTMETGAPDGGMFLRHNSPGNTNGPASSAAVSLPAATTFSGAIWCRTLASMAAGREYSSFHLGPGYAWLPIPTGVYDWTRTQIVLATIAGGSDSFYLAFLASPGSAIDFALPDVQAGLYPSTWIPTVGGEATRAAELCAINASNVGGSSGYVSFLWSPLYASTAFATVATLFEWGTNWRLDYDGADDTLKVIVNGTARAQSAALTFAAGAMLRVSVRYSSAGQWLTVDGVVTSDATSWGSPTLAPYLGSRGASANCESAAYGDLLLAA